MEIRRADPADALAVAQVHVRSWRAAYRGLLPDAYLDGLRSEDRAQKYDFATTNPAKPHTLVAIEEQSIVGFATTAPAHDADLPGMGELNALYVDPAFWGRGAGAALITAARSRLVAQGFCRAYLWLLKGNARADRFYRIDGWLPDGCERTGTVWGIAVNEIRFQRAL